MDELMVIGPREKSSALVRKCHHGTVWRWNPTIWFTSHRQHGNVSYRGEWDTERVKGYRCGKPNRPLNAPIEVH